MQTEAKRQMLTGIGPVDDESLWVLNHLVILVARGVPHNDLVALLDVLAIKLSVHLRRATHIGQGRLPTDDLRDHIRNQRHISTQLFVFLGELVEREHAPGDRVAGRVVAADNQQENIAQIFHGRHILCCLTMGEHRD